MSLRAALDADVLVRMPLCDTLLRLAGAELFDPVWSDRILAEVQRALVSDLGVPVGKAERRVQMMREVFGSATVAPEHIDRLEPRMTNAFGDRHVLAAAVAAGAQVIVTFNTRDFPREACKPLGVEALHPDDFLVRQLGLDRRKVRFVLHEQAAGLSRPPVTLDVVLDTLSDFVPVFVETFRRMPST